MLAEGEGSSPSSTRPSAGPSGAAVPRRAAPSFRASMLAVLLAVAACAIALAALWTASRLWYAALYTFTVFLLLTAVLAARYRRGGERAFWFGFAVFGWGLFLLGFGPWIHFPDDLDDMCRSIPNPNLLTTRLILALLPSLQPDANDLATLRDRTENTLGIAHLLMTLVVALIGGLLAIAIRRRPRARPSARSVSILAVLVLATAVAISIRAPTGSFPAGAFFGSNPMRDAFHRHWYSRHLAAMGEPSLPDLAEHDRNATVYRLLWLPSFHHPVCVRIRPAGIGARLQVKVLDGRGGYEPGHLAIDRRLDPGPDAWAGLEDLLTASAFWEMPTRLDSGGGTDGDQLILEGVGGGRYHVVDRWEAEPIYEALCHYMLDLPRLEFREQWRHYHAREEGVPFR